LLRYRQPGFSSRENETMRSASHPIERLLPVTEIIPPCRFVQWITMDTASPLPRIHLPMDQTEPLSDHDDAFSARRIIMLTRQDLEATRVIYSITSTLGGCGIGRRAVGSVRLRQMPRPSLPVESRPLVVNNGLLPPPASSEVWAKGRARSLLRGVFI